MGVLKRWKQWRKALRKRFEIKEEKENYRMLDELQRVMPNDLREIAEKEGDQDLFLKLIMDIYQKFKKKDLLNELFDEKLAHLEVVERLVTVVFFSSVQLKLFTPLSFNDNDLLQHFPGSLARKSKKKCVLLGVIHGALTWKKVKEHYEMNVSSVTCTIEDNLVELWNNDDGTVRKFQALESLLNQLTVTCNCLQNYCSDFGYPLKQTLRLVPKDGQHELQLITPSQTAVFRGQHFYGPVREGPFLRFELESTMLQLTVVPIKGEDEYRWSVCVYQFSEEGHWVPDFRCRFAHVK